MDDRSETVEVIDGVCRVCNSGPVMRVTVVETRPWHGDPSVILPDIFYQHYRCSYGHQFTEQPLHAFEDALATSFGVR